MKKLVTMLILLAVIIAGCGNLGKQAHPAEVVATAPPVRVTKATPVPSEATTAVSDEHGFNMELGSVRVSAPAGVAAAGTQVLVSTAAEPAPAEAEKFSNAVGEPVRVVLGDRQQPQQPVTIVFDLTGTELAAGVSPESPLAVLSRSGESGDIEAIPAEWDAQAQTLTVVTDHLSWFWPFRLDVSKLFQPMLEALTIMQGTRYPAPDCFGESLTIGTVTYTIEPVPSEVVWPCLTHTSGQIVLELHANSPLPWRARTDPSVPGDVPSTLSSSGLLVAAIYRQLYAHYANKESLVVPGGSTSFRFDPANPPERVSVQAEAALYLVATTVWNVETALELFGINVELLDDIATLDCISEVVDTGVQTDIERGLRNFLSMTFTCLQTATTGFAAFVLAAFTSGVGLIVGGIQGAIGELRGTNTVSFSILREEAAPPMPTVRAIPDSGSALFQIQQGGKHGYIDQMGNVVIEPQFDYAGQFSEGLAYVIEDDKVGYIDGTGRYVIEPQFGTWAESGIGGTDTLGPDDFFTFSEGLASVIRGGKHGYIDQSGAFVIEPQFDYAGDFSEGRAPVLVDDGWGFIDRTGQFILEPQGGFVEGFSEGLAAVEVGDKWGYIDRTGTFVIEPQFDYATVFSGGLAVIGVSDPSTYRAQWGYIDTTGNIVVEPQYDMAVSFTEGLAAVQVGDRWGYIDTTGQFVIEPQFVIQSPDVGFISFTWMFSEGLAAMQVDDTWGYIDKTGTFVIQPQFDWAEEFSGGLAEVWIGDKRGYINRTGTFVWSNK
jgi:hypothetical protein